MYKIGELSEMTGLQTDTIRYYEKIDLLKPSRVDPNNGYRYYSNDNAKRLFAIIEWKKYGFSLDTIRELMQCTDNERLREVFGHKLKQLDMERNQLDKTMRILQQRFNAMMEDSTMGRNRVLLIDDSAFMRMMQTDGLNKHGYEVVGEAEEGEAGIKQFETLSSDLVVIDIGLPDMDGVAVARTIREMDKGVHIVMCSARGHISQIVASLQAGADEFVVKPFQMETLVAAAEREQRDGYEESTMSALLADRRIAENVNHVLSQPVIDALLHVCREGFRPGDDAYESFWNDVSIMTP
ncbi:response regulator [Paenibacillus sp. PR3]|uniref:Response regulator n=1 Tax=Paenibacillus terricola TaxID=2763503 RepID=A0ABR8MX85_9BACL|nr:response regulator [Paenibacillus terricola]MBD3920547.1 response regulator [Paenibacillus terricola]